MRTTIIVIVLIIVGALLTWMMISGPDEEEGKEGDVVEAKGGLKYVEVKIGTGRKAKAGNTVIVHYTGRLENNRKFDSSVDRQEPFKLKLGAGEVIKGWDIGLAGMREGGKRKLMIPPELGYGVRGSPPAIPPNATLIFDVELLKVQ